MGGPTRKAVKYEKKALKQSLMQLRNMAADWGGEVRNSSSTRARTASPPPPDLIPSSLWAQTGRPLTDERRMISKDFKFASMRMTTHHVMYRHHRRSYG